MKKLLITLVIVLLTILTIVAIVRGVQLGGLEILGITGMNEKNTELDEEITEATKLASTDYPRATEQIEQNLKDLQKQKQTYDDMVTVSTDSQVEQATQFAKYEQEKLYILLGSHARSEGVDIDLVFSVSNNLSNAYDINFEVTGAFISVTDYIADIEDDSELGFKIENFKMTANGGDEVKATFVCKDIVINNITQISTGINDQNTEGTTNGNTANNTNSTNTTNTTGNTTNTTRTTNTTNTTNTTR